MSIELYHPNQMTYIYAGVGLSLILLLGYIVEQIARNKYKKSMKKGLNIDANDHHNQQRGNFIDVLEIYR